MTAVRTSRLFLVLALAAGGALSATPARAQSAAEGQDAKRKEAQAFFDDGIRLAKANDNKGALAAFREAYSRFPSFRVLYNIGQLCARMGDAACAVRSYEGYLRDGDKEIPPKRRKEVESEVRALSRTVARLTITANVEGADVTVDDEPVGETPLAEPVAVNGGQHKVVITQGSARAESSVNVVSGGTAAVELELKTEPPPADPAPVQTEAAPSKPPVVAAESPSMVPWIVTGGLAAVTVVSGVLAASAWGDFKETRDSFPISRDELDSAHGKARDFFLLTTAFGVATLVSAGVATYFTLGGRSPDPAADQKKSSASTPRRLALVPTLGGLVLVGGLP